jgi:hypothetical protein
MERPARLALALAALALPAAAQIKLVQKTPAEIGASMMLEVTDATPSATIVLVGSVTFGSTPTLGVTPPALGMSKPLPGGPGLFHTILGTTSVFGTLTAGVALPPSTGLLGRVLPMRAVDLGAFSDEDALSNPLAAWIGPHPVAISPTPQTTGNYGWSLAIGDFLGSPALDVAVGANLETVSGAFGAGKVHVYEGPGFTSVTTLTPPMPSVGGFFGWSLAALDWDGDGATDLAVGEPGKDGVFPFTNIGAVHVLAHPVGSGGSTTFTDPTPAANEQMGIALAAGNLDASPNDELVAGASFHGAAQPVDVFASILILTYSGGSASIGEVSEPNLAGGGFGECVAMGDVDADGFAEILVGEPNHDEPGASDCGAVHLVDGGAVTLSILDDAPAMGDKLGASVAIGDLNGDGLGDLLVGVFGTSENHAQVYFAPGFPASSPKLLERAHPADIHGGRAVAVADVNGDGKLDALVAFGSCEVPGFGVVCGSVTAYLGKNLVRTAYVADSEITPWSLATGDVDGDGRDEIAVGHPGASPLFLSGAGAFLLSE